MSEHWARTTASAGPEKSPSLLVGFSVALIIAGTGLGSLSYFYRHGLSNLYGDGLAHLEIARRLFDSLTPGWAEIGSVWLPMFHLLAAPLTLNDFLWRSGLAGSIVSVVAFMLAAWLLFKLSWSMNQSLAAAVVALAVFLLSPNLLYLASTPLTEPLAICWHLLTAYSLFRFAERGRIRSLVGAALAGFCGSLTRYDGWYLLPWAALFVLWARAGTWRARLGRAGLFSALAGMGPLLWMAHNASRYGNPLEFYNGRNSALAIYQHQVATTGFPYPTDGSLPVAARYYVADLVLIIGPWILMLAIMGLAAWAAGSSWWRRRAVMWLLVAPFPFYVYALAHAAIPLYVPTLFPWTHYNLRYGIQMLPALAVAASFLVPRAAKPALRWATAWAIILVAFGQAVSLSWNGPRELSVAKEGILNTPCRSPRQEFVRRFLAEHDNGTTLIMAAGHWPCVLPELGIPYRRAMTDANRPYWSKLAAAVPPWVGWIIRGEGDTVDELLRAHPQILKEFQLIERKVHSGEGTVEIYQRRSTPPRAQRTTDRVATVRLHAPNCPLPT